MHKSFRPTLTSTAHYLHTFSKKPDQEFQATIGPSVKFGAVPGFNALKRIINGDSQQKRNAAVKNIAKMRTDHKKSVLIEDALRKPYICGNPQDFEEQKQYLEDLLTAAQTIKDKALGSKLVQEIKTKIRQVKASDVLESMFRAIDDFSKIPGVWQHRYLSYSELPENRKRRLTSRTWLERQLNYPSK